MEISEVVMRLIGAVEPIGETHADDKRFTNLTNLTLLVNSLLCEIESIYRLNKQSSEYSVKRASAHCESFLRMIAREFEIEE